MCNFSFEHFRDNISYFALGSSAEMSSRLLQSIYFDSNSFIKLIAAAAEFFCCHNYQPK